MKAALVQLQTSNVAILKDFGCQTSNVAIHKDFGCHLPAACPIVKMSMMKGAGIAARAGMRRTKVARVNVSSRVGFHHAVVANSLRGKIFTTATKVNQVGSSRYLMKGGGSVPAHLHAFACVWRLGFRPFSFLLY